VEFTTERIHRFKKVLNKMCPTNKLSRTGHRNDNISRNSDFIMKAMKAGSSAGGVAPSFFAAGCGTFWRPFRKRMMVAVAGKSLRNAFTANE